MALRATPVSFEPAVEWFHNQGWEPFAFQTEAWQSYLEGQSGLIHSATGTGKTFAAWMGPLLEPNTGPGLKVIWITPLRALAFDTWQSLQMAADALRPGWRVEMRTGDTSPTEKQRQIKNQSDALITTPESLTLMLSRKEASKLLGGVQAVVCDEWHELMGSKRGVQTELALARLRTLNPRMRTWGVSATLGNLETAREVLLGPGKPGTIISGDLPKEIVIDSLLPDSMERFPWAGHLGVRMVEPVCEAIAQSDSCLIFCNTRSQVELWFQAITGARPEWKGKIEVHHGSLDREVREAVEQGIKTGKLRAVVCTSSLDLGVDFSPVDRVLQIGSPKGVARLLQRAGRSGHQPGRPSRVTCVPTHALELLDIAAARRTAEEKQIEGREPVKLALDVLAQHLVTLGLGEGFVESELKAEVRRTYAYADLSDEDWERVMTFVTAGGPSLSAYNEFKKLEPEGDRWVVKERRIAHQHRLNIGTIVSDSSIQIRMLKGGFVGTIEENFVSRLKPGDVFMFSGRFLQFVRVKDLTCWVRKATKSKGAVPRWGGGRMPLSNELARSIRERLDEAHQGVIDQPETQALLPLLTLQANWSRLPQRNEFLVEQVASREGEHLFFFPVEGRLVHEGLSALFAYRLTRELAITFTIACNDYGFELLSDQRVEITPELVRELASLENLLDDIQASLNASEMAKRQFREIARIAGLVFQGYPGSKKSGKQLQASSGLFFDVFQRYEPDNLLLQQAHREVLERQLEQSRLRRALDRLGASDIVITQPPRPTPLCFPILVDRLRETVSSEGMKERVERMVLALEKQAGPR